MQAGNYPNGLNLASLRGTAGNVITITGPESGGAAIFEGSNVRTTVQLQDTSFVTLRYLNIDGKSLSDPHAVDADGH